MTDDEALQKIDHLLNMEVKAGPTWLMAVDVFLWAKEAHKRLPAPKKTRQQYMRDYMREYQRKRRAKQIGALRASDGTQ